MGVGGGGGGLIRFQPPPPIINTIKIIWQATLKLVYFTNGEGGRLKIVKNVS